MTFRALIILFVIFSIECSIGKYVYDNSLARNTTKKSHDDKKAIVCYLSKPIDKANLQPDEIDPTICTHIIVGFASVSNNSVTAGSDLIAYFNKTVNLKKVEPDLKVMFTIGGGGNDKGFSTAVSNAENRAVFIKSIISFTKKLQMDGVDLDWEFPAWYSPLEDKPNFAQFLREFREEIDKLPSKMLLSVAVSATEPIITDSYEPDSLAAYCDFINLMSYDFHDYKPLEDPFTGFNSPLFARSVEKSLFSKLNLAYAAEYWVHLGIPRSKLYVGIPVYAHVYKLAVSYLNDVDAPAAGTGGDWSYSQCCEFISQGATVKFNNESLVPFMFKDLTWVSYENEDSVTYKAKWIKTQNYGGIMVFDLNTDDWQNNCTAGAFPLIKAIKKAFA